MNAYGLNLECNVIGGLLLWPEEFGAQVFARLQENDFEEELLSEIFAAARKSARATIWAWSKRSHRIAAAARSKNR